MEEFILKLLKKTEAELDTLVSEKEQTYKFGGQEIKIHSEKDYWARFYRLTGAKDTLYMILTGHNNTYGREET